MGKLLGGIFMPPNTKDVSCREEVLIVQLHIHYYKTKNFNLSNVSFRGGFKVIPEKVEFWQGQSSRLHDRISFRKPEADEVIDENLTKKGEDGWVYERLAP